MNKKDTHSNKTHWLNVYYVFAKYEIRYLLCYR